MKVFKSLSFLFGTFVFLFISEPSYGKEINLTCKPQLVSITSNNKNIPPQTTPAKDTVKDAILSLYPYKERFELTDFNGKTFQGKATFFKAQIQFYYEIPNPSFTTKLTFVVDRETLSFSETSKIEMGYGIIMNSDTTGLCRVITAPSTKKNLI